MASTSMSAIELFYIGNRTKVSFPSNSTFNDIINQFCAKIGIENIDFAISFHNKTFPNHLAFNRSKIPNNALCEIVYHKESKKKDSKLKIAIEYSKKRYQFEIKSDTPLWYILEFAEKEYKIPLISSVDEKGQYMEPTCQLLQKKYCGIPTLLRTTLPSLGIFQGSLVIRVTHSMSLLSLDDVNSLIEQHHSKSKSSQTLDQHRISTDHLPKPKIENSTTPLQDIKVDEILPTPDIEIKPAIQDIKK